MTASPTTSPDRRRTLIVAAVAVAVVVVLIGAIVGAVALGRALAPNPSGAAPGAAPSSSAPIGDAPTPAASGDTRPTPPPTRSLDIESPATIAPALTAEVTRTEAVQGTAQVPGEIAGPAVRFTVTVRNGTGRTVDLSNTVVNAYYGDDRTPANAIGQPGGRPFPASVAAGDTVTGTYLFVIPAADRSDVQVTVDTGVSNPVIAFGGDTPR